MMNEELNELINEHADNLEVLDCLSPESFKNLYISLVTNLLEITEEEWWIHITKKVISKLVKKLL